MNYLSGTAAHLGKRWLGALGVYRHRVFVQRLGWDLPEATEDGEWDRFDRTDTVHVISLDGKGRLTGCARLLPTTRPYLLSEVFPQLLDGGPAPHCVEVWELSRFAACDLGNAAGAEHSLGSEQALALLRASMRTAYRYGARGLVSVSPIAIQRILRHGRFEFSRLGQTHHIGGHSLFACGLPMHSALQQTPILF
jgi:N-acyl-L-homoserine lactone synthetase